MYWTAPELGGRMENEKLLPFDISEVPEDVWSDRAVALKFVETTQGMGLRYLPAEFQADREIVKAAIYEEAS